MNLGQIWKALNAVYFFFIGRWKLWSVWDKTPWIKFSGNYNSSDVQRGMEGAERRQWEHRKKWYSVDLFQTGHRGRGEGGVNRRHSGFLFKLFPYPSSSRFLLLVPRKSLGWGSGLWIEPLLLVCVCQIPQMPWKGEKVGNNWPSIGQALRNTCGKADMWICAGLGTGRPRFKAHCNLLSSVCRP